MNKKYFNQGFTLAEIIIVLFIIGLISTIGTLGYNSIQKKSKTDQNKHYAKETIQAIETFKGFAGTGGGRYPSKNSSNNDFTPEDQNIKKYMSEYLLNNISFSEKPSISKSKKIYIETCYKLIEGDEIPVGAKVHYWDYTKKQIGFESIGLDESKTNVSCR